MTSTDSSSYANTIDWVRSNNGFYHPALIRKKDPSSGVYGIYTTEKITKGDLICRIPKECGLFFDKYETPNNWNIKLKMSYMILREKNAVLKGEKSDFAEIFANVTTLDEFKQYHPYFMTDAEKEELIKCNPIWSMLFANTSSILTNDLQHIKDFDDSFSDDLITEAIVINNTRTWSGMFLPVMDFFNHSAVKGNIINTNERVSSAYAKVDYEPGDQVYLSYGNKDMLMLSYEYGFYDENDYHFVFPLVFNYTATTPLDFAIAKKCMDLGMKGIIDENNGQSLVVGIQDFGKIEQLGKLVCLSKDGISTDLYKFFELFAISNLQELEIGAGTRLQTLILMSKHLSNMRGERITFDRLPNGSSAYHMMLNVLEERLAIIDDCLTWVNDEITKINGGTQEASEKK